GVRDPRVVGTVLRLRRGRSGRRDRPRPRRSDVRGAPGPGRPAGHDRALEPGLVHADMEHAHATDVTGAGGAGAAPALLVSLHDVSPLTLEDCRRALAMLRDGGFALTELTALAIPRHEGRASL